MLSISAGFKELTSISDGIHLYAHGNIFLGLQEGFLSHLEGTLSRFGEVVLNIDIKQYSLAETKYLDYATRHHVGIPRNCAF